MGSIGICRLCGRQAPLVESHIIPSFVFAAQKAGSSTGFLRFGQKPNLRQQDGTKTPLLCEQCEGLLNKHETPFATEFFRPFHERQRDSFDYGPWMAKCCVSVSWRVLTFLKEHDHVATSGLLDAEVNQALEVWRSFLLDERSDIGLFEQHLLLMDAIEDSTSELPRKINRYLMCATEIDFLQSNVVAVVYSKMARLVLVGFVREPEACRWQGTKVDLGSGTLMPGKSTAPAWLWDYLKKRAERMAQLESQISARQKHKVRESQKANPERVMNSDTLRAALEDNRSSSEAGD